MDPENLAPAAATPTARQLEADALRRALLTLLPALALGDTARAQDATKVQPDSYRVALDNDQLRVLDFFSRPGMGVCGNGLHSHPAHLTVALTAARVRETVQNGKPEIGETPAGFVFWSEAVTHITENVTGRDVRALIIELKHGKA